MNRRAVVVGSWARAAALRTGAACAAAALALAAGPGCRTGGSPALAEPFRIGSVTVDPGARSVIATGYVNQVEGPVELLACGPGGKRHESVFVVEASPVDVQAGLLLLGLKTGTAPTALGAGRPEGVELDLEIVWQEGGRRRSAKAEEFLLRVPASAAERDVKWIFTGSVIQDGKFMALEEESVIATYWDPWAIVNIGAESGASDESYEANRKALPALETPVEIVFRAARSER